MKKKPRILFARPDHIGDLILCLPTFKAIKQLIPDSHLTVWVRAPFAGLLEGNPHVDRVIVHPFYLFERDGTEHRLWDDLRFLAKAGVGRADITITPSYLSEIATLLSFLAPSIRVGYQVAQSQVWPGYDAINRPLEKLKQPVHQIYRNLYLLTALQPDFDFMNFSAEFALPPALADFWKGMDSLGLRAGEYLILHCGAGTSAKCWPLDYFEQLLSKLNAKPALRVVLTGSAAEQSMLLGLAQKVAPAAVIIAGEQSWSFLTALVKHSAVVIAGDTSIMHLAAVQNVPTVDIHAGTNDPIVWGPFGKKVSCLHHQTDCFQCHLKVCSRQHECMTQISPAQVYAAALDLLAEARLART